MKITIIPIDQLKRPKINIRHHPKKQIDEMMRSLTMFGQTRPMVLDDEYTVLVGNGMLTAMEELGLKMVFAVADSGGNLVAFRLDLNGGEAPWNPEEEKSGTCTWTLENLRREGPIALKGPMTLRRIAPQTDIVLE